MDNFYWAQCNTERIEKLINCYSQTVSNNNYYNFYGMDNTSQSIAANEIKISELGNIDTKNNVQQMKTLMHNK